MYKDAMKKFDLTGRTAVVTGGGSGIGYFMARGLARSGARVLIAQRRGDVLKASVDRLRRESDGDVCCATVDLNDRGDIERFCNDALAELGHVDIFVGNGAHATYEQIESVSNESIDKTFQVNVSSNMEMMRAFVPGMKERKWGRILFSSSAGSIVGAANDAMSVYGASKGALNALTITAAAELGHYGITVNSLLFGPYATELAQEHWADIERTRGKQARKAFIASYSDMTALGRVGRPDEVEGLIQFMASNAGSYVTGTNFSVDGGLAIMLRPNPSPEDAVYASSILALPDAAK